MKPENFRYLANMLKKESGLVLTEDKAYLLESRLMPVARKQNLTGLDDLVEVLMKEANLLLKKDVIEAMTTNESFFFRDVKPFDQFKDVVLPYMLKSRAKTRKLRIWCAAASSGQEPYSLAMILKNEQAKLAGWNVEIVGTDISDDILEKAKAGLYTQFEVQRGLPVQMLVKYFSKVDEKWQINNEIRSMVKFKNWNLLENLNGLGQFDVVFCRNVLIYFDQQTKGEVLDRIAGNMPKDAFLYLGGAETVLGITDKFKPLAGQRGVYCLADSGK
ncbi:MAG: protein-glutamate O-methyltransferase [Alphaproteobacteria bacterium]|nr:protein-glutamate O-methyltransferase [Alphaproteobacteria bacterium]